MKGGAMRYFNLSRSDISIGNLVLPMEPETGIHLELVRAKEDPHRYYIFGITAGDPVGQEEGTLFDRKRTGKIVNNVEIFPESALEALDQSWAGRVLVFIDPVQHEWIINNFGRSSIYLIVRYDAALGHIVPVPSNLGKIFDKYL